MTLPSEKKLNPSVLETNVLELVEATKLKISALTEDISVLKKSIEQIEGVAKRVESEINDGNLTLSALNEKIKQEQDREEALMQKRDELQKELQDKKTQLADELESMERRNGELRGKMKKLTEEERLLKDNKETESNINKKRLVASKRNITKLHRALMLKDNEIGKLKAELEMLIQKDNARIQALENEKRRILELFPVDNNEIKPSS